MKTNTSEGILKYNIFNKDNYSLRLEVDNGIIDYFRWFINKVADIRPQKYSSHISVVRKEIPSNLNNWNKYQDEIVEFKYENEVYYCSKYYWINAYSNRLLDIREELGLSRCKYGHENFHITIGNIK